MNCKLCLRAIVIEEGFYRVGDDCYCIKCYDKPTKFVFCRADDNKRSQFNRKKNLNFVKADSKGDTIL